METADFKAIEAAIERGDDDAAWPICISMLNEYEEAEIVDLALDLLETRLAAVDPAQRATLASKGIAEVERARPAIDAAAALVHMGSILFDAGLARDAANKWLQAVEKDPTNQTAAHYLGLAELRAAAATGAGRLETLAERWRRAWAWLSVSLYGFPYFAEWTVRRYDVYGLDPDGKTADEARKIIAREFDRRIAAQLERFRAEGATQAVELLFKLREEFQIDQAGIAMFGYARSHHRSTETTSVPLPFGLLWFRLGLCTDDAVRYLREIIEATRFRQLPADEGAAGDPLLTTAGTALRQWYSRLSAVRYSIRWGHFEAAARQLESLCNTGDGCQTNPKPHFPYKYRAPRCCDPQCSKFAVCNPGYALSETGARDMELDAHRLAIFVQLALAGQWLKCNPPDYLEAARHWTHAHTLSVAVGETSDLEQFVTGQVIERVTDSRDKPEVYRRMVEAAMGAVPSPALRGRFADLLTSNGIDKCNNGQWEEGVHELRLGWSLNKMSDRALRNFTLGLQNLAMLQRRRRETTAADSTLDELLAVIDALPAEMRADGEIQEIDRWARSQTRTAR